MEKRTIGLMTLALGTLVATGAAVYTGSITRAKIYSSAATAGVFVTGLYASRSLRNQGGNPPNPANPPAASSGSLDYTAIHSQDQKNLADLAKISLAAGSTNKTIEIESQTGNKFTRFFGIGTSSRARYTVRDNP